MTNNSVTQNKVVNQLVQYFTISDTCLDGLTKVLGETRRGLVKDLCHKVDSDSENDNSQPNIKSVEDNISPKTASLIKSSELNNRQVQKISAPVNDPLYKFKEQLEESENTVLEKQGVIKERIQGQIGETRQTIAALMGQAQLLQIAELCQTERKKVIKDGKTIKNNLQENYKKISKHIQNSNIDASEKEAQLKKLEHQTKKEIAEVKRNEAKLKKAINETRRNVNSQTKRIKEQSQLLKTEVKDLENQLKHLMLTPADKKEIYEVFMKTVTALQNASESGISKKSLKITIRVVKGIISIAITIFQEGTSISAFKSSLQTIIETGKDVLELYRQENLD